MSQQQLLQFRPHLLESYRLGLAAAVLLQFSHRGLPQERAAALGLGDNKVLRELLAEDGWVPKL